MNAIFKELDVKDIEIKIGECSDQIVELLLHKNARVDQNMLDRSVGVTNWRSDFKEIRGVIYCTISIFDEDKNEWVGKTDCGRPIFPEKEKSEASDAFKRAATQWGIGRELYSAPRIIIPLSGVHIEFSKAGNPICTDSFSIERYEVTDQRITALTIKNMTSGMIVFDFCNEKNAESTDESKEAPKKRGKKKKEAEDAPSEPVIQDDTKPEETSVEETKNEEDPSSSVPAIPPGIAESFDIQLMSPEKARSIVIDLKEAGGHTIGEMEAVAPKKFYWVYTHTGSNEVKSAIAALAKVNGEVKKVMDMIEKVA